MLSRVFASASWQRGSPGDSRKSDFLKRSRLVVGLPCLRAGCQGRAVRYPAIDRLSARCMRRALLAGSSASKLVSRLAWRPQASAALAA